jgi:radical SAM superfamily enzyme YgiQ (UPF0313 family)
MNIIFVSVHLERGPDSVALGAGCVAAAVKAAFERGVEATEKGRRHAVGRQHAVGTQHAVSVQIVESYAADGVEGLLGKVWPLLRDAVAAGERLAVGFSMYVWNRGIMVEAARRLREEWGERDGLLLFVGGPEATALPEGLAAGETRSEPSPGPSFREGGSGPFDVVVRGEGEAQAVSLLAGWLGSSGTADAGGGLVAGEADFEPSLSPSLGKGSKGTGDFFWGPSPYLSGVLRPGESALWELTRGCPYHCAYCYESGVFRTGDGGIPAGRDITQWGRNGRPQGSPLRHIDEGRLEAELDLFIGRGVRYVAVLDPTFNSDNDRAMRLLDLIAAKCEAALKAGRGGQGNRGVQWHFEARGELVTRGQAKRFARLDEIGRRAGEGGVSLQIGLQSADPAVCARIGRGLDIGRFRRGIGFLNDEGLSFGLDLIYGLPGEGITGFRRSLDFALSLYPNNLDMFRLSVLPRTRLAAEGAELGLHWQEEPPYDVTETAECSAKELAAEAALADAANLFYNEGRAVPWFNEVLFPVKMKASAFLAGFGEWRKGEKHRTIEEMQIAYLRKVYRMKKKEALLPEVEEMVHYHWAESREMAGEAERL